MHAASRAQVQGQEENMTLRPRHDFAATSLLLWWKCFLGIPSYPPYTTEIGEGGRAIFTEILCVIRQRCRRTAEYAYVVLEAVARDACNNPILTSADSELTVSGCIFGGKTLDDVTRYEHTGKTLATNKDGSQ